MASDRDDRWGDEPRDDDRRRPDPGAARSMVKGPAIGLIAIGVLTLAVLAYGLAVEYPKMDASFEAEIKKIDDNPDLPADQKKMQKDMMNSIKDPMKAFVLPFYALVGLGAVVILFGGVKMLGLSGRGLAMTASILAMIPCFTSYACVLGIPIGIWALIVLGKPEVKAAFAAKGRPADGDADEGWGRPDRG